MRKKEKCYAYFAVKNPEILEKNSTLKKVAENFCGNCVWLYEEMINDFRKIKVGETTNLKSRKKQLEKDGDCIIVNYIEWEGTKAQRFFVESYLRTKIENAYPKNATNFGNDHFKCNNSKIIKAIASHFEQWALEGLELSKAI